MAPVVSVIIPSYNHEKFIKECIESVLNQTYQDFEIVITDDASRDHTVDIINSFNDPRIKIFVHDQNRGVSVAANNCVRHSSGKYIAWLSSDDAWLPRKLELQVDYLDHHPEVGAVFSKVQWVDRSGERITDEKFRYLHVFDVENRSRFEWLRHFFYEANCLNIPSSLVRRECYTETNSFDPSLANLPDFDLWIKLCLQYEIHILDDELVRNRRVNEESNASGDNLRTRLRSRFEYKQLLDHYLKLRDERELFMVFPEASKYGTVTNELIPYFVARTAIDTGQDFMTLWGLEVIYRMLGNEETAKQLKEQCSFTHLDLIKLTGERDAFNLAQIESLHTQVIQKEQYFQIALQTALNELQSSESYKIATLFYKARLLIMPLASRREQIVRQVIRGLRRLSSAGVRPYILELREKLRFHGKGQGLEEKQLTPMLFARKDIPAAAPSTAENTKEWAAFFAKAKLGVFLSSNAALELPRHDQPEVSIILLFHNRVEMSLQCLETLAEGAGDISFEVIIINNASTDETSEVLGRVQNAKIVTNAANVGFGAGCNQAVDLAVGKYLLFLNNDTQLMPNSIKALVETMRAEKNIGAVGGKLVFADGRLQEAGSIVWQDGSCLGYGRYDDPSKPEYSYKKDVDFCSGAMLLTPRELFLSMGKFDPRYEPAYYEDADYCMELWSQGYRVVYQPLAVAIHFEFGAGGMANALAMQTTNRDKFKEKWQRILPEYYLPDARNVIMARERHTDCQRILVIDDQIPDYRIGSGMPRTYQFLQELAATGCRLTYFPVQIATKIPDIVCALQARGVEMFYTEDAEKIDFNDFLKSRPNYYDVIFVSRPHNMRELRQVLRGQAGKAVIVYDAEALFSLRELKFRELQGEHLDESSKEAVIRSEVNLVKGADLVTTVSSFEKSLFEKYGAPSVHILGHVTEPELTTTPLEDRRDILFVGGFLGTPSPNQDAISYFVDKIQPLVQQKIKCALYIVGSNRVKAIWDLESEDIHVMGQVADLAPYYNRSRLFIVPTRYSAGIPLKLVEAAAHGLPAVVTPLTANQLGWAEDRDLLVGHDEQDFADKVCELYTNPGLFERLRQNAFERVQAEYSHDRFQRDLQSILRLAATKYASQE